MPEWSKGSDSSSDVVRLVGSNPTPYNIYCLVYIVFTFLLFYIFFVFDFLDFDFDFDFVFDFLDFFPPRPHRPCTPQFAY